VTAQAGPRGVFAAQLRADFDRAFSLPVQAQADPGRHLLAIRVGEFAYALDPGEIAGLQVDRAVVPVPGLLPEWMGLAGIRGGLVPVYSLAALLGHRQAAGAAPRWLVLSGSEQLLGLAFDAFEGHLNLEPSRIAAADPAATGTRHVRAVAQADLSRPVIGIPSVAAEIARRCATVTVSKEK
jgi:purine-binding chemotaxis protein CheW